MNASVKDIVATAAASTYINRCTEAKCGSSRCYSGGSGLLAAAVAAASQSSAAAQSLAATSTLPPTSAREC